MPADLRAHVRYPETLIKTQAEVFALYHTQDINSFFQREDLWNVARQVAPSADKTQPSAEQSIEPYFVLMQLPGEKEGVEFVEILPFTPSNRNNMIGWIAGRCDGDAYGSLLAYNFPKSSATPNVQQLVNRAVQEFDDYQRLTSEGKLAEAGKKLEEHKRTLEELKKAGSKLP